MTARLEPYATLAAGRATLRFFLGDCLAWLPRLPAHSVGAVVTSPPYNLGIKYRSYEDTMPRDEYLAWTGRWVAAVSGALAPQGSLFLNVGAKPTDPWVALDIAQAVRPHLQLQNTIHWIKSIVIESDAAGARSGLEGDLAVGHYKPINSPRFLNDCHEFIFHFTPFGATRLERTAIGVPYQDKSNITRWQSASGGRRCRGNAWFLPYDTINSREKDRPHPATFPVRLPEYCLRLHGIRRAQPVLDPFTGLGNTALACVALGLDFVGIELDRHYLDEAISRVRRAIASGAAQGSSSGVARGSESDVAPASPAGVARGSESDVAPASPAGVARGSESDVAPASPAGVARGSESDVAPASPAGVARGFCLADPALPFDDPPVAKPARKRRIRQVRQGPPRGR